MIKRDECLKLLASKIADDEIVVAAYTTAFEWIAIRPSPLNFISSGAMGLTSSHALGFALAWPDRRHRSGGPPEPRAPPSDPAAPSR